MTWYEFLLFVHISAAVIWVGAGFLLMVLALRADRTDDEAAILVLGVGYSITRAQAVGAREAPAQAS